MELKKGYRVKGVYKDGKEFFKGKVAYVDGDGAGIMRDDKETGGGNFIEGYGNTWKVCKKSDGSWDAGSAFDLLKIISKSKEISIEPKFLVIWEEDKDPTRFFNTKEDADKFIKELVEKTSVKKDSIILVEIKSIKKVEVKISKKLITTTYKI